MIRGSFKFEKLELGKTYTIQYPYENNETWFFINVKLKKNE